jgi:hypothetical protein
MALAGLDRRRNANAYGVAITVVDPADPTAVDIPASVGRMEPWAGCLIPRENSITDAVPAGAAPARSARRPAGVLRRPATSS